jgi:hypothetical protein
MRKGAEWLYNVRDFNRILATVRERARRPTIEELA